MCNKETKYYVSTNTFNSLLQLEPLLSEQVGRVRLFSDNRFFIFIYLFGVLRCFQHCTGGHITAGSWKGRGNQYIQFVRVLYCKLPTNTMTSNYQLSHLRPCREPKPRPQRLEARVLPLCHRGPFQIIEDS